MVQTGDSFEVRSQARGPLSSSKIECRRRARERRDCTKEKAVQRL
jgi:hypothetical protein